MLGLPAIITVPPLSAPNELTCFMLFLTDGRVGSCFAYLSETGECADRLPVPLSNRDCCCGYNMGRAWGDMCTPCPPRGSSELFFIIYRRYSEKSE